MVKHFKNPSVMGIRISFKIVVFRKHPEPEPMKYSITLNNVDLLLLHLDLLSR